MNSMRWMYHVSIGLLEKVKMDGVLLFVFLVV
jgi:hypothetical protein